MFILLTLRTTFIKQQTQIESTHQTAWLGWGVLMPGREQASPGPRQLRSWAAGDTDAALTRALAKIGAVVGKMCLNGSASENCKLQKPLNMRIFNIFHRIDDDKRWILWVWDRSDAAPWPSTGTQEVSADESDSWCGIFLELVFSHESGSWNPWKLFKAGGCRWRWADLLGRVQGGSHLMTCQFFFPKKHVEELIW